MNRFFTGNQRTRPPGVVTHTAQGETCLHGHQSPSPDRFALAIKKGPSGPFWFDPPAAG
jgi:hypothetical protein